MLEANHLLTSPFNTDITKGYVMIGLTKAETNQRFVKLLSPMSRSINVNLLIRVLEEGVRSPVWVCFYP